MINETVRNTNAEIQKIIDQNVLREVARKDVAHIRLTDNVEMISFFGLLYARGLLGQNTQNYKLLCRESIGHPYLELYVMSV